MKSPLLTLLAVAVAGNCSVALAGEPPITAVAFTPDGKQVVAVSQSGLQVCGWPDLNLMRTLPARPSNLHSVAFSPNGRLVAVGGGNPAEDGVVQVFSWPGIAPVATLKGHEDSVRCVVWKDDRTLVSAGLDRRIKLWDLRRRARPVATWEGHSRSVDAICLIENNYTLISAGADQSLRVWNVESGRLLRGLNQHTKPVHALAVRPGGGGLPMVASAAGDRTIRIWQPTIGRLVRYIKLDAEPLRIAWLDEQITLVAACVDGRVRVVDIDEVRVTRTLEAIDGWAYALAVHPADGSLVVGGSDGQLKRVIP